MYSILVVDDEPRHRNGLSNMLRKLRPEYRIFEAKNGKTAIELTCEEHMDIIITDIKMPIMDGLQFIEALGSKIKDVKVIILSAYGYFEFAQKAIGLGAFDYLLKPVDEEKVVQMLHKVEENIKSRFIEKTEKEILLRQLEGAMPVYMELQLDKWVKGEINKNRLEEIRKLFPYSGCGTVALVELKDFKHRYEGYTNEEIFEIRQNIKYWVEEALKNLGNAMTFFLNEDSIRIASVISLENNNEFYSKEKLDIVYSCINNLNTDFGVSCILSIGRKRENIFEEVSRAYKEANQALEYKFYLWEEKLILFPLLESKIISRGKLDNKRNFMKLKEEKLTEAVRKLYKEDALAIIEDIMNSMRREGFLKPTHFKDFIINILLGQVHNIRNVINEERFAEIEENISDDLKEYEYYKDFVLGAMHIIAKIIDILNDNMSRKNELIFNKCLEYIEAHYAEDIYLDKVAEMLYFNPSYFSCVFKNYTGINFSSYLLNVRMKKAKELLSATDFKVYEIAARVGYNDPKYFNRLFKKHYGITPDEYRRLGGKCP